MSRVRQGPASDGGVFLHPCTRLHQGERRPAGFFEAQAVERLRREYELVCAFEDRIDVAEQLRQAGVPVFLYGAGAVAAAEALEALDVRQDDLVSGAADPLVGKRKRQGADEDA
jgi:hypothetical protein